MQNTLTATLFLKTWNRIPARSREVETDLVGVPAGSTAEQILALAYESGVSKGFRTFAGVYEIQTDEGIYSRRDGKALHFGKVEFKTWDELEAEERAERSIGSTGS